MYASNINHLDLTLPLVSFFFISVVLLVILNYTTIHWLAFWSFSQEAAGIHQQLWALTSQVQELKGLILELKEIVSGLKSAHDAESRDAAFTPPPLPPPLDISIQVPKT